MRTLLQFSLALSLSGSLFAQYPALTLPPDGNNQKASVTQFIGPLKVTIDYSSPAVHGPGGANDRRGQIWGKLVPYGMSDLGFRGGKLSPWRGGANENTVLTVSARRVKVKPAKHEYREWLTYEFTTRRPAEATAELQWEELAVPFNIRVANVNEIYVTKLRQELTGAAGFNPQAYDQAAQFCVKAGVHLEDALAWADLAIGAPFLGQTNFDTLSTKALVLTKMGRDPEAATAMQAAVHHPTATSQDIHQYGRQLLAAKKNQEALDIFKLNAERNGEAWPVNVGLARGYMAVGDYKKAAEYAQKAAAQAPDPINKKNLESMAATLAQGKPYDN